MSNLYTYTTRQFSTPYLTVAEYKQAPTGMDYDNLVVASNDPAVQDAELANVIARASSWMDNYCYQILGATVDTETQRARLNSDGTLAIHPRYFPIIAVLSLSYGSMPNDLVNYPDPSQGWIEEQQFILPYSSAQLTWSSQGPLSFGMPAIPRQPVYVKYSYVNGFPTTLLANQVSANASSIVVKNPTGIIAGTQMTIYDGENTENVTVGSSYTFGSTTVPLVTPTQFSHVANTSISALPPAVKEAAILATTAFLKIRGDSSMTMQVTNQVPPIRTDTQNMPDDFNVAKELLRPYRRVR